MPTRNDTGHYPDSIASNPWEKPKEKTLAERAEQATEAVGAGMESLGKAIREHEPHDGVLNVAGEAVANKLEAGGRYLEEHGLKGIGEDLTNMIRRNPVPALLIGVGIGLLFARIMRS